MDGLKLCCQFSYVPNKLRYCGPDKADKVLKDYILFNKNKDKVRNLLKRFEALYPYLELIAEKNRKRPFDYDVVEAYWLGNDLLENINTDDIKKLIKNMTKRGLPAFIAEKLIKKMPAGLLPHHSFHVFFVGVGALTKRLENTVKNMDKCRISWAKAIDRNTAEYSPISIKNKFVFGEKQRTKIKGFFKIKKQDDIALHWDFAVKKLDKKELAALKKYTLYNIKILNTLNSF